MISIDPISTALVPADSAAADALGAPNYDEFQSDLEVWDLLQRRPRSVLRVTMPHCDVPLASDIVDEHDPAVLARARASMDELRRSPLTRTVNDALFVYEMTSPGLPGVRQIGLGGMARTAEIRTALAPGAPIIRNEGIRESKARGRAILVEATAADMGTVNNAVDDDDGGFERELASWAAAHVPDFTTRDEAGDLHRVWLIDGPADVERMARLLGREQRAYVADGNHRSAAAAMLGHRNFLAVFFPAATMTIAPYNRLVGGAGVEAPFEMIASETGRLFRIEPYDGSGALQPAATHQIGIYDGRQWRTLRPRDGTFDPEDAAQDIDADIVQRNLFAAVFGIGDPRDDRLTFVGANRDAGWLAAQVDAGNHSYAITLPPVTMEQFVRVCRQDRLMPPKSTWFVPKIRSGLVMALDA